MVHINEYTTTHRFVSLDEKEKEIIESFLTEKRIKWRYSDTCECHNAYIETLWLVDTNLSKEEKNELIEILRDNDMIDNIDIGRSMIDPIDS
jgi:hypothetical protein